MQAEHGLSLYIETAKHNILFDMGQTDLFSGNAEKLGTGMYTAIHATLPQERNRGLEKALPITIGDNCWLGGDVKIMPGVTIDSNTIIGAGSVVTRDIPDNVVAVGSPCRVLRPITEADSINNLGANND